MPTEASHIMSAPPAAQFALDDVKEAARRIDGAIVKTPTLFSNTLSKIAGANIWLKYENLQYTSAYKERGALNALLQLSAKDRARGVIAASAGNHSQGLSYHGSRLGIPVKIVMPIITPDVKVQKTRSLGGDVILQGATFDDAYAHAQELAERDGLTFVHPFDDPNVAAGQGTVALEMLEAVPELDTLVVPIGGGGLICGTAVAAKAINPDIRIIGVQSNRFPAFYNFKHAKEIQGGGATLAEGIAVKYPGKLGLWAVDTLVDDVRIVNEGMIETAIAYLIDYEKTVVEGAGAAALATLLPAQFGGKPKAEFAGRNIGVILTGGNIDMRFLANVILGNLGRIGRIARIAIRLRDEVGALEEIVRIFSANRANIIEIAHQRIFGGASAKNLATEIEYEVPDTEMGEQLVRSLLEAGYDFDRILISGQRSKAFLDKKNKRKDV